MKSRDSRGHLSRISTPWSMVCQAHRGTAEAMNAARQVLLERYGGAIIRYLRKSLAEADAADELYQEFALCFVKGDFRRANRERGRFRDYIKGVLFKLIVDYRQQRHRRWKRSLPVEDAELAVNPSALADQDREFLENWRDELLAKTWKQLADSERQTGRPVYTVLRFRVEHSELTSEEMAKTLGAQLGKSLTAVGARQLVYRAREKFADLLIAEVMHSLQDPTLEQIEEELGDLGLLDYCRPRLKRGAQD